MNIDRQMVARAVFAGQLPAEVLTTEEMLEIQLNLMDAIGVKKMDEGKVVFADHETLQ